MVKSQIPFSARKSFSTFGLKEKRNACIRRSIAPSLKSWSAHPNSLRAWNIASTLAGSISLRAVPTQKGANFDLAYVVNGPGRFGLCQFSPAIFTCSDCQDLCSDRLPAGNIQRCIANDDYFFPVEFTPQDFL